jgi:septum formation protein
VRTLKLVLASRSPRRAELLTSAGIEFTVRTVDIDETPRAGEDPMDYVLRLAEEKARAAPLNADETILAADTTVVLGREILGKPSDRADAAKMLGELSERKHQVITGICLRNRQRVLCEACVTAVWFAPLSAAEIEDYVASDEPMDKAGAYGIQGIASRFIERIEGSYTNVVGLPVAMVYRLLREF